MFEGDGDVDDVVVVVVGDSDAVVVVDRRSEADRVQDVVFWLLNLVDFAEMEQRSAEGPELNFGQIITIVMLAPDGNRTRDPPTISPISSALDPFAHLC